MLGQQALVVHQLWNMPPWRQKKLLKAALHTLYVEETEKDGIVFEIDGGSEVTYKAASKKTITFTFTAETTPIRNGEVSFAIPNNWSPPKPKSADAKTAGKVGLTITSGKSAKLDDDKTHIPEISNRVITVKLERLAKGGVVTVTYGTDGVGKAQVQEDKPSSGKITIDGRFRTSSGSRSAGTVTVNIENVADGTGSAEIATSESIEAGSNDNYVQVKFTAAGTMDGGKVSLEVPQGWGTPQTDPTKRNYIAATPSSRVSDLEVQGDTVIASITKLGPGQDITFTYGRGTGGDNNGVVVQDNIAVAKFYVSSDGDGDEIFELVKAEDKFADLSASDKARNEKRLRKLYVDVEGDGTTDGDGVLQISVVSATGGTGLAAVDPAKVRAAATDVKLTFTYTPSRTIRDGKLKFTVPSTGVGAWSPPQVENAGSPGFTEVEWTRASLGTAEVDPDDSNSIVVPIIQIDREGKITIIYGSGSGAAMAPTAVGTSTFKISLQGPEDDDPFVELEADSPQVAIQPQASGKGDAVATIADDDGDLAAGDSDRMIEIEYTAAGEMVAGDRSTYRSRCCRPHRSRWLGLCEC